jgi:hypothetical protein
MGVMDDAALKIQVSVAAPLSVSGLVNNPTPLMQ